MMKNILENVEYLIKLIKEKPCEACNNKRTLLPWLTKQEVMTHLRISETTYYGWRKEKILQPDSNIGEDRYLIESINDFIAGKGQRKRLKKRPEPSKD